MKRDASLVSLAVSYVLLVWCIFAVANAAGAQTQDQNRFEEYRNAIKKEYSIDIRLFKDKIRGGRADGKDITKYDLQQLLMGIKVELEHTDNRMTALEITTDHLEQMPDYYTRLLKMEKEAEDAMEKKEKVEKSKK